MAGTGERSCSAEGSAGSASQALPSSPPSTTITRRRTRQSLSCAGWSPITSNTGLGQCAFIKGREVLRQCPVANRAKPQKPHNCDLFLMTELLKVIFVCLQGQRTVQVTGIYERCIYGDFESAPLPWYGCANTLQVFPYNGICTFVCVY